jgi:hypothetical protein
MKISIDTQHDSPDDIQKVIELLQQMINRSPYRQSSYSGSNDMFADDSSSSSPSRDIFTPSEPSEPSSPSSGGLFNMFGSPPASSGIPDDEDDSGSTDDEEEKPEPRPQVIMY